MSVETQLLDRTFSPLLMGTDIVLDPDMYSVDVQGGPLEAILQAFGSETTISAVTEWLRCPVIIRADDDEVWWGFVASVEIMVGAWAIGSSIDTMINRVNIVYNPPLLYGTADQAETGWDQDDESVSIYGIKEQLITIADITESQALAEQAHILSERRYPLGTLDLADSGGLQATLHCRGWLETLKWRYFNQPAGYIGHISGSQTQKLGLGLSGTGIGFSAEKRTIHDLGARLGAFKKDDRLVVTSGGSNSGIFTVEQSTSKTAISYTAATLSWGTESGPHWKLYDSANGLGDYDAGDMVFLSGGVNTGWYRVLAGAGNGAWIEVDRTVTTAAAGASITVQRGNSIVVAETLIDAYPSGTTTITIYGDAIAQRFLTSVGGWTVGAIAIKGRAVGTPVDGLRIALYSSSAGNPNTLLDSLTIAAADLPTSNDWITATLSNTITTAAATSYHVEVERTGANHDANYYEVVVDEDLGYPDGELRLKYGGAWNVAYTRIPAADMLFRVIGHKELTEQIRDIITSCGEFFEGVDVIDASGVVTPQYRDGQSTAYDELMALLDATTTGQRLIATVTPQRWLRITAEPDQPDTTTPAPYALDRDGQLRDKLGRVILATKPVWGVWVDLAVWGDLGIRAKIASVASLFIEGMEVSPKTGKQRPRARGTESRYAVGGIKRG